MMTADSLLAEIESFCSRTGLSETKFGLLAAKDGHLIRRLRMDRSMTLKRIEKVQRFMADYRPGNSSEAAA